MLYITWDGPQVNYLEGLFLPILNGLQKRYEVSVVQFTWGDKEKSDAVAARLLASGIRYKRVTIGPRSVVSLGILLTLIRGTFLLQSHLRNADVVLFRSTYPCLMMLPWRKGTRRWVFDTDGLPLEEKVEFAGMDAGGFSFRWMKRAESRVIRKSDRVLLRSMKATYALPPVSHYRVVGNGRDPSVYCIPDDRTRQAQREQLGVRPEELLLVYSGSLGTQYCLPEMLEMLQRLQEKRPARLMILTGVPEYLQGMTLPDNVLVKKLDAGSVPRYLGAADAAVAIRKASPSMRAVSPVKLGEYLLCGLPVVASAGIGDTEDVLRGQEACLILTDHRSSDLGSAADWVCGVAGKEGIRLSARKLGLEKFSLGESILSYQAALEGL